VKILTEAITALRHNVKEMMTLNLDQEDRQWQGFRPSGLPRSGLVQFSIDSTLRGISPFLLEESGFYDAVNSTFLGGSVRAKNSAYERGAE
jgi:hypothetical protein